MRDRGTLIPLLCIDMNPGTGPFAMTQRHYLRRSGYPCNGRPNIAVTHLSADGKPFWNDPYGWGGRTYPVAHNYIIKNWEEIRDGDVIDVEFILGETTVKKVSERHGQ